MNPVIPTWWLVLSGLYFFMMIALLGILGFVALKVVGVVQELKPKVDDLTTKVKEIGTKLEGIADKVEHLADDLRTKVSDVGDKASSVASSVELVTNSASRQFERFAPFITGALTAIRLAKALNEMRAGRKASTATSKKALEGKPATPVRSKRRRLLGIL